MNNSENFLIFNLGDVVLGVSLSYVEKIVDASEFERVEVDGAKFFKFKNEIYPAVDFYEKFGIFREREQKNQAIILHSAKISPVALIGSECVIKSLKKDRILQLPDLIFETDARKYFSSVAVDDGKVILLLNVDSLFSEIDVKDMKEAIEKIER